MSETLSQKIRDLIKENLVAFESDLEFTDDDNFFELGFVNSLFAMTLVTFIESEFNMEISNDDLNISNFSTINNIQSFIEKKAA
ncbi:MAG: acyl carrier protein [bacterium]|nr:acyl carrier protein [bacterium]